jgi:hypothetical protein
MTVRRPGAFVLQLYFPGDEMPSWTFEYDQPFAVPEVGEIISLYHDAHNVDDEVILVVAIRRSFAYIKTGMSMGVYVSLWVEPFES